MNTIDEIQDKLFEIGEKLNNEPDVKPFFDITSPAPAGHDNGPVLKIDGSTYILEFHERGMLDYTRTFSSSDDLIYYYTRQALREITRAHSTATKRMTQEEKGSRDEHELWLMKKINPEWAERLADNTGN